MRDRLVQRIAPVSAIVLALALALVSAPAGAQETPDQQLATVRELVMYANYRTALPAVQAFLERTDLGAQQRNAGLEMLAIVELALRHEASARAALEELYARDPGHRLSDPDSSPVVQSAFARARESASAHTVTIEHSPPSLARRQAPEIDVRLSEGADAVHEIRVAYREQGGQRWTQVVLGVEGGRASGRIPVTGEEDAAVTIEYYLEALAPSATVLARAGSAEAPLAIVVPANERVVTVAQPIEEAPSLPPPSDDTGVIVAVVVISAVLVGGGVGAGVGVALATQGPSEGSLGAVTLPLARF